MTRSQHRYPKHESGWDKPPQVAASKSFKIMGENHGSLNARFCNWKTPQRILTLNPSIPSRAQRNGKMRDEATPGGSLCSPIIAYNKFIIVASSMKVVAFGDFDTDHTPKQSTIDSTVKHPLLEIDLTSKTEDFLSSTSCDKIIKLSFHEETGILYAITAQSCAFQLKFLSQGQKTQNSSQNAESDSTSDYIDATLFDGQPKLILQHQWRTKNLGTTCMATVHDGGNTGSDAVYIGYKSGCIEAWKVDQVPLAPSKQKATSLGNVQEKNKKSPSTLLWEGYFDESIWALSTLFRKPTDTEDLCKTETIHLGKDDRETPNKAPGTYLVVVLGTSTQLSDDSRDQSVLSSMVKILDLEDITNELPKSSKSGGTRTKMHLRLRKYTISCFEGIETTHTMNERHVQSDSYHRSPTLLPTLDSHGTNIVCNLSTTNTEGGNSKGGVGVALPDGNIILLSSHQKKSQGSIANLANVNASGRMILSHPAISIAEVNLNQGTKEADSSYLAACLRGGTCYLIPFDSSSADRIDSTFAIPFPQDLESDMPYIYIQAFTAGNIMVNEQTLPVLVFVWPNGILDIYSCSLLFQSTTDKEILLGMNHSVTAMSNDTQGSFVSRSERRALQELIDNNSLSVVSKIIQEWRESSSKPFVLPEAEWKELVKKTKKEGDLVDFEILSSVVDLCTPKYELLRRTLLQISSCSTDN